jgi:anti-anti-sigma factor
MANQPVQHGPGAAPDRLEIRRVRRPDGVELQLCEDLTLATATTLVDELTQAERSRPALLVLDLRRLRFIDSTGLAELVAVHNRRRRDGRRLVVVVGPGPVDRLFTMTGLGGQFETARRPPDVKPRDAPPGGPTRHSSRPTG